MSGTNRFPPLLHTDPLIGTPRASGAFVLFPCKVPSSSLHTYHSAHHYSSRTAVFSGTVFPPAGRTFLTTLIHLYNQFNNKSSNDLGPGKEHSDTFRQNCEPGSSLEEEAYGAASVLNGQIQHPPGKIVEHHCAPFPTLAGKRSCL